MQGSTAVTGQFNDVAMAWYLVLNAVPSAVAPPMIAIAIRLASSAYSTAVAPESSVKNLATSLFTTNSSDGSPWQVPDAGHGQQAVLRLQQRKEEKLKSLASIDAPLRLIEPAVNTSLTRAGAGIRLGEKLANMMIRRAKRLPRGRRPTATNVSAASSNRLRRR